MERAGPGSSRGGLVVVRVIQAVINGASAWLVRSALVLDHGCLAAKGLCAIVMLAGIGSLASVNPAVASQTGRLYSGNVVSTLVNCRKKEEGQKIKEWQILTSEKRLSQSACWHTCGFSPVWVRIWTVSALLWINFLSHPAQLQA